MRIIVDGITALCVAGIIFSGSTLVDLAVSTNRKSLQSENAFVTLTLFSFFALVFGTLGWVGRRRIRRARQVIREMRAGQRIVGWRLNPAEHARFLDARFRLRIGLNLRGLDKGTAVIPLLFAGGVALWTGIQEHGVEAFSSVKAWLFFGGSIGSLALFAWLLSLLIQFYGKMRWRNEPCEVLISDKAIYRTGRYLDFDCSEQAVKDTELISRDSPILKVFHGDESMSRGHRILRQSIYLPLRNQDGPVVKVLVDELRKTE